MLSLPLFRNVPRETGVNVDPKEALPLALKQLPDEIWSHIFSFLQPKDHYHASLTCRVWCNLTKKYFNFYREQIFDCFTCLWCQTLQTLDVKTQHDIPVDCTLDEISGLDVDEIKIFFTKPTTSKIHKFCKQSTHLVHNYFTKKKEKDVFFKSLESIFSFISQEFSKNPNHVYLLDLSAALISLPGFRYVISNIQVASNVIYSDASNFASAFEKSIDNKKIEKLIISTGVLNNQKCIQEVNKHVESVRSINAVIVFTSNFGDAYENGESSLISQIAKIFTKTGHFFSSSAGLQDRDAFEIAKLITNCPRFISLGFKDESQISNVGLIAIQEAIVQSQRTLFGVYIQNDDKAYLESIHEAMENLRTCPHVRLL